MNKNDDRNSKVFLAGMVIGVILAVVVGGCLIMSKIIKVEDKEETVVSDKIDDVTDQKDVKITEVTFNGENILISDIMRETIYISSAGVSDSSHDYYVDLKESGKVYVRAVDMQGSGNNYEGYLSNVSDVVDIIKFSVPASPAEQLIYILQANGDVYYYKVGNSSNNNFTVKKVDDVSNIKKLFIYNYPLNGALGGTWSLVGIKDNGETVEIIKEGV